MAKFFINCYEIRKKGIEVEANSLRDAYELANTQCKNGKVSFDDIDPYHEFEKSISHVRIPEIKEEHFR